MGQQEHTEGEDLNALRRDLTDLQMQCQWFAVLVRWELELTRTFGRVGRRGKAHVSTKTRQGSGQAMFHLPLLAS